MIGEVRGVHLMPGYLSEPAFEPDKLQTVRDGKRSPVEEDVMVRA